MKDFFKNKKVLIGIASVLILAILIVGSIFLFKDNKKDNKENKLLKEQTYTMYVKINPLVKLTFKETYYECSYVNDDGKEEKTICSDKEDNIMEYTLINDDAKDIYNTIDFKGKTVLEALIVLCDVARDNKVAFENLEIVSDYNFDKEELIKKIESGSTYENKINVYVDFKEFINENEIIEDLENEEPIKTYIVSFDSNGGSKIDKQEIKENEKAKEPNSPTKKGYDFVEWQLNGEKYNFDTTITDNITLTATWKKKTNQNTNNTTKPNNNNNNNNQSNQEETITKEVRLKNHKVKGLNADSDSKIVEAIFHGYEVNLPVTITGKKSLVDSINSDNLQLGVDLSQYKEKGEYKAKLIVVNPVNGVTYKFNDNVIARVSIKKKVVSTPDKINLNDNILVYEESGEANQIILSDNFKEIFGSDYVLIDQTDGTCNGHPSSGIPSSEFDKLASKLTMNQNTLNNFFTNLDNIKNSKIQNVINFQYKYEPNNLHFSYSYNYLSIADEDIVNLKHLGDKRLDTVLKQSFINHYGYYVCGGGGYEPKESKILNEALCTKYNLNCSRW